MRVIEGEGGNLTDEVPDVAVVIKCCDDRRVLDCLESIDHPCEVVVSLVASPELERELAGRGVRYCLAPRGNLGRTCNLGIAATSAPRIILMDSDSTFAPGCIRRLAEALDESPVASARIRFLRDSRVPGSGLVAGLRSYINGGAVRAYTPGLAFQRWIGERLGGWFNEEVRWAEDAEFDWRIRLADLHIVAPPGAEVRHAPTSLLHDLKSAYRYGYGKRLGVESVQRTREEDAEFLIRRLLRGDWFRDGWQILSGAGLRVLLYKIVWNVAYYSGYYVQKVLRTHGVASRRAP